MQQPNAMPNTRTPHTLDPAQLTEALNGMFDHFLRSEAQASQEAATAVLQSPQGIQAVEAVTGGRPEHFHLLWLYPLEKVSRGVLAHAGVPFGSQASDLFLHYSFFESHFKYVYDTFEGGACCADKSRWVLRALLRHFQSGSPIAVPTEENAFWAPKKVLNTQESILGYFHALRQLHAGRPDSYLKALAQIAEQR